MKILILLLCNVIFLISFSSLRADELSDLKEELEALKRQSYLQSQKMELFEERIQQMKQAQEEEREKIVNIDKWKAEQEEDTAFLNDEVSRFRKSISKMIDWNIYGNVDFEDFHREDNMFDAESIEFIFRGSITPRLEFHGELEFERAASVGEERGGSIEFERAYIDYLINEYINVRAGVLMVPFGRYNQEHFAPFRDLADRPLVDKEIIPTDWVDVGAGFFGNIPLTDEITLDYEVYLINGFTDDITDKGFRDAIPGFGSDNNNNKAGVGRMLLNPHPGIELGLSGYFGKYDKEDNDAAGIGIDWKAIHGPFELIGEYAFFNLESGLNDVGMSVPDEMHGFYIQTNYHFWPKFLDNTFLGRQFDFPTLTGAFRYGVIEIDDDGDANSGDNRERRYTIGLNYRPVETFVIKLEYQINQTKNETLVHGDENGFILSTAFAF